MSEFVMREGHYLPSLYYQKYDYLKLFPLRFWDVVHAEDDVEEEVVQSLDKRCKRCEREIKPQYTYCYRCNNYLKVKARIAKDMAS